MGKGLVIVLTAVLLVATSALGDCARSGTARDTQDANRGTDRAALSM